MIYINNTLISSKLFIESVDGLFDFPSLKSTERNWLRRDLVEFDDSRKSWQFESKEITINAAIVADTYVQCETAYGALLSAIRQDDLLMMTIPSYSNRGYLVHNISSEHVRTNYNLGYCVFRLKLKFIEPQPFNIQFFYDIGSIPTALDLSIGKPSPGLSTASERQKYVNVWFQGTNTEVNIEQGLYNYSGTLSADTRHTCIISGDVDEVAYIYSSVDPSYKTIANYYMRNGGITVP